MSLHQHPRDLPVSPKGVPEVLGASWRRPKAPRTARDRAQKVWIQTECLRSYACRVFHVCQSFPKRREHPWSRWIDENSVLAYPRSCWIDGNNVLEPLRSRWIYENSVLEHPRRRWIHENSVLEYPRSRWIDKNSVLPKGSMQFRFSLS